MRRRLLGLAVLAMVLAGAHADAQYYASFGKNKVRYDTFEWKIYPTPHFRISFYDEVEPSLEKVASFAESSYDELARRLNFQIPDPIPLIVYATHADFEQTNVMVMFIPEGVGAFAEPARNRMVMPVDLPDLGLQELIQHELTHIFQYEILFQGKLGKALAIRPPQWFMEGMASYFADDEDSRAEAVMRDAALSDAVPSVGAPVGGYFGYRFGHKVFQFVEAEWGPQGLRDFIFEFRNTLGSGVAKALRRAFDLDIEEFDAKFHSWLRKYYRDVAYERGEPREFGRRFRVQQQTSSVEASPAASPSGDLIAAFSTYKQDVDVVILGVPDRTLYKNLTKGNTTDYEYVVAQALTVGPERGRDLSFSPDGETVAVFARRGNRRVLLLLDAVKGGIREEYGIPVGQAMNPAFSTDGRSVAFHAFENGQADIFLLDLDSREVTNLTDDAAYDTAPVFAPDGTHIVYSSQVGEEAKLVSMSVADPSQRDQLTFGPGNDEGASFSRDGASLYFASDRDEGIFDIYSLDLESREIERLTHVFGAAVNPVAVPTRDGERIVYQAYTKSRWLLYEADPTLAEPVGEQAPPEEAEAPMPYLPPVSVTIDQDKVEDKRSHKLFVDNVQLLVGINEGNELLSLTYLSMSDYYGDRRVEALLESVSGYQNLLLQYSNLNGRLQWGAVVYDDRSYYLGVDTLRGEINREKRQFRQTGGAVFAQYPLSLYHRIQGNLGFVSRDINFPVQLPDGRIGFENYSDEIPFAQLGVTGDTTFWKEYGPHAGRRWRLDLNYGYDLKEGGTLSKGFVIDARQYVPISRRNELALRLYAAAADGNRPNLYYFGGLDTLRGFRYREIWGNRAAFANIEWRFPLIDHLVFPWMYIRNIRGRLFLDVGAGWVDVPGYPNNFKFWEDGHLKDGVSSYGFGFSANLLGLPMHWDFAKLWDFKKDLTSGYKTSFWVGFRY